MIDILDTSFFDPIAPYIRSIAPGKNYLEIELPFGLIIDKNEVLKYFKEDLIIVYRAGTRPMIKGSLKDPMLFNYLVVKFYSSGIS